MLCNMKLHIYIYIHICICPPILLYIYTLDYYPEQVSSSGPCGVVRDVDSATAPLNLRVAPVVSHGVSRGLSHHESAPLWRHEFVSVGR